MVEKQNLTIRIEEGVLKKARELGLNLSATTEGFLKMATLTEAHDLVKTPQLRAQYNQVFMQIIEILKEWGVTWFLKVGGYKEDDGDHYFQHTLYLDPEGRIIHYVEEIDRELGIWHLNEDWPVSFIGTPAEIISNLIDTVYRRAEENRKKVGEIIALKRLLEKLKEDKSQLDSL